jgi:hypothetical protein
MARGGYRKPSKPASVSGPGAKSRRTDGGPAQILRDLPDAKYGENASFQQMQQDAPLANSAAQGAPAPSGGTAAPVVPFHAPSGRPGEPVTSGNPMGPGPGPQAAGLGGGAPGDQPQNMDQLMGMLPVLNVIANGPNGTPALRKLVRYLKSQG